MEVETSTGAVAAMPGQRPSSPAGGYGVVLLVGIILLGGCLLGIMLGQLDAERRESEARARTLAELATVRARLEGTVQATFNLTAGIVHLLRQDGDISPQRFAGMAAQSIDSARYIRNITLAPDDVIKLIYPLEGNEQAIGTDFRRIPAQYPTIQRARELNQPILAGPVALVQGGRGLIHRRPVFIPDPKGPPRYWGAASMVADVDKIMAAGGLSQDGELKVALRGADGQGEQGGLIWGDGSVFAQQPATMTVQIPGGTWQLAAVPKSGWPATSLLASPYFLLTLINTGLVALFVGQLGRRNQLIRRRNADLQQEVQERQRVQASLMDSEERFRKLFDLSPDATWVVRNGAFLDWNAAALSLFGVADKAEALASAPVRFSPAQQPDGADSVEKGEAMMQAAVIRGIHRFDWQYCRADGQLFPAEVTLCPMILGGEKLMYAVIRDISERQAAREALERSQSLLFGIVDNAPSLIYVFDTLGRLQLCNRGFETAVGHPRDAIIGHAREHFLAPLAAREHRQNDLTVIASGQPMRFEEQNLEAGGNHVYLTAKCPLVGADGSTQAVIGISTDITELRQTADQLRLAGVVLESTADGVMITDPQGKIVSVNRAFTDITGYSAEEAIGQRSSLLRSEHQPPDFYQQMWHSIQEAGVWHGEIWNRRKNGELYPEWLTINAIYGDERQILNYVGVFSDISTIKHSQAELERLAHFDPLTELPNRTLFHDRLQHALERSQRYGQDLAVLLLDLDGFKTVNDSLGHPMGDLLLCQAAQRFKQCLRVEDTVARLGGDEFAIILNNLGQETDAVAVVKKLLQALQEPFDLEGTSALVTTSIGIAISPMDGETTEELVRNADAAMYGAKEGGRNNYRFYQSEMTRRAQERLSQERALRRALEEGEFEVWYQPKLDLESGRVLGAEALLRWRDPVRGLVAPGEFIPMAERTGLIVPIGEQVLNTVCRQARQWREAGLLPGRIAVNVAALQIERSDFAQTLEAALASNGLAPEALEIEVTESLIMENPSHARQVLGAIQALGVTTAVDDFGTGYSSLAYLKLLPINHLKIDRAFVADIPGNANDVAIARAIIALGHSLGFAITAEGIETAEQLEFLRQEGCDAGQGYYFSRPLPAGDFAAWLQQPERLV